MPDLNDNSVLIIAGKSGQLNDGTAAGLLRQTLQQTNAVNDIFGSTGLLVVGDTSIGIAQHAIRRGELSQEEINDIMDNELPGSR